MVTWVITATPTRARTVTAKTANRCLSIELPPLSTNKPLGLLSRPQSGLAVNEHFRFGFPNSFHWRFQSGFQSGFCPAAPERTRSAPPENPTAQNGRSRSRFLIYEEAVPVKSLLVQPYHLLSLATRGQSSIRALLSTPCYTNSGSQSDTGVLSRDHEKSGESRALACYCAWRSIQ